MKRAGIAEGYIAFALGRIESVMMARQHHQPQFLQLRRVEIGAESGDLQLKTARNLEGSRSKGL
jgi:hypothetical protein